MDANLSLKLLGVYELFSNLLFQLIVAAVVAQTVFVLLMTRARAMLDGLEKPVMPHVRKYVSIFRARYAFVTSEYFYYK